MTINFEFPESPTNFDGIADEALNTAAKYIQDLIGQTDGGVAAQFFSGPSGEAITRSLSAYAQMEAMIAKSRPKPPATPRVLIAVLFWGNEPMDWMICPAPMNAEMLGTWAADKARNDVLTYDDDPDDCGLRLRWADDTPELRGQKAVPNAGKHNAGIPNFGPTTELDVSFRQLEAEAHMVMERLLAKRHVPPVPDDLSAREAILIAIGALSAADPASLPGQARTWLEGIVAQKGCDVHEPNCDRLTDLISVIIRG
jgi:hypothetical protein